ncbi:hypothetical protein Cgig2_030072 [Carnegiea gigantea]|uniref:Uncharacterized protein n=1 Tax=Carnegiea gigantea TaxID=171969 RepID=A0A9Q1GTI1_9CARY|nr:hypothetical protein Cgig2_030072 [Carnegiea gigantea]
MALYGLANFEWYRRRLAFRPLPLPSDYKDLCPDFDLIVFEKYARDYDLPEIPQVVFFAMLLNDAVKLELQWSTFEAWVGRNRGRILEARCQEMDVDQDKEESSGETFKWQLRRASRSFHPLPEDYQDLCLRFTLPIAKKATHDFDIPEIVQATFYAMVINNVVLSVVSRDMAGALKSTLKGLRWTSFDSWLNVNKHALLGRSSKGKEFTRHFRFLEITQAVFYVMVPNDAVELGVMSRVVDNALMDVPEGLVGPQMVGRHPQFPSLPALIDGEMVAHILPKNQFRKPKKIPYTVPIFKPGTPSWSSCEYSSTPSILNIEEDVVYLWEIDVAVNRMHDFQKHRMAKIRMIGQLRSPDNPKGSQRDRGPYVEKLSPFETRPATTEYIIAEAERVRQEERRRHMEMQAKKAPSLAPHSKKPLVVPLNLPHMGSRKHPRAADRPNAAAAAPSSKGKEIEGLVQHQRSGDGSASDERAAPQTVGEPLVNTQALAADFLAANTSTKRALVEKLAKSWSLAPPNSAEPSAVDEEQATMAEVARSRSSVSTLEKRICDFESSSALLQGQIGDL